MFSLPSDRTRLEVMSRWTVVYEWVFFLNYQLIKETYVSDAIIQMLERYCEDFVYSVYIGWTWVDLEDLWFKSYWTTIKVLFVYFNDDFCSQRN